MFPGNCEFAFTILDDTDDTTLRNGPPTYEVLRDNGLRTTKTVWTFDVPAEQRGIFHAGESLETADYLEWVQRLEKEGFEIAFHNASMSTSDRNKTAQAHDQLARYFEHDVRLHCNHGQNRENLFWGAARYQSAPTNLLARLRNREFGNRYYQGEVPESQYYWADIANERFSYIRSMASRRLNGAEIRPGRPFRDPRKLAKPVFFNTADAPDCGAFNQLVNKSSIDALARDNGWAIVSTHLGKGFCKDGKLDKTFVETIQYLSSMRGWFVPVSQLLDFLVDREGCAPLGPLGRFIMECAHVVDRLGKA